MVSVLACHSDNLSSSPTEGNSFFCKCCFKRTKINKKWPGFGLFKLPIRIQALAISKNVNLLLTSYKRLYGREPWSSSYGR